MKLFFKILFFIFTMIIIAIEAKSSIAVTILQEETSYSLIQKSQFGVILFEKHNANSCLNGKNVVTCSKWGIITNTIVAKGGSKYIDIFLADSKVITSRNRILGKGLDKIYTQLSVEELTAIHHYTTGAYKDFNNALRTANGNISALDDFNRGFYEILQSGMQKMPNKFSGQLYRGTSLSDELLLKYKNAFQNNTTVTEYAFTSTNKQFDPKLITKFQNLAKEKGESNVIMYFNAKGKNAVDIDNISRYGKNFIELGGDLQEEALFMSGTKFKVTGFDEAISNEGVKYFKIIFTEIP